MTLFGATPSLLTYKPNPTLLEQVGFVAVLSLFHPCFSLKGEKKLNMPAFSVSIDRCGMFEENLGLFHSHSLSGQPWVSLLLQFFFLFFPSACPS